MANQTLLTEKLTAVSPARRTFAAMHRSESPMTTQPSESSQSSTFVQFPSTENLKLSQCKQPTNKTRRLWTRTILSFVSVLTLSVLSSLVFDQNTASAQAKYNPNHPEVRALVAKGMDYLRNEAGNPDEGDQIIIALAALNSHNEFGFLKDPLVVRGVTTVIGMIPEFKKHAGDIDGAGKIPGLRANVHAYNRMYEACVALMLLVEYDDQRFDEQIRILIDFIVKRQNSMGCWTYNSDNLVGDTSQTQYCCLALWIAKKKGFDIPLDHASKAARFWTGHQAGNGTWAYKCVRGQRQGSNSLSLTSAGAGSLYMLGDILSVNKKKRNRALGKGKNRLVLPAFVQRMTAREVAQLLEKEKGLGKNAPKKATIDASLLSSIASSKQRARQWFTSNYTKQLESNHFWTKYALYGFERYATFREEIDGKVDEVGDWYDQGIEFVKEHQKKDGSLGPGGNEGTLAAHTSLAILFMVRSTQRLTRSIQNAPLRAGSDLANTITVRDGQVIGVSEQKDLDTVLSEIKQGGKMSPEEQVRFFRAILDTVENSVKGKPKAHQLVLLRSLVKEPNALVRKIAIRILGKTRLMDNCPALIFAMTDPDPYVVEEAGTALLFVSRKIEGIPVPSAKLQKTNPAEYKMLQKRAYDYWVKWYKDVDPEAQLLELPEG